MLSTWLSYDDLNRWSRPAWTVPTLGHTIVFGMSDNPSTFWDNARARHIGYRPQDSRMLPRGADRPHADARPADPTVIYQGGGFVRMGPWTERAAAP